MARIRTIKPEFFDDEDIAALSFAGRLAFIGLWLEADREGRLKDRPVRLKARIFPFDDVDMPALLEELERRQFIERYTVDGLALIQIRTFTKHQHINQREAASSLPPPPTSTPVHAQTEQVLARGEGKGKEGKEYSSASLLDAQPLSPGTTPAVLTFPTIGKGPKTWEFTAAHLEELKAAYPGVDVLGECRKALVWVKAKRPKTSQGMPVFLVNWLNRATNNGRRLPTQVTGQPSANVDDFVMRRNKDRYAGMRFGK